VILARAACPAVEDSQTVRWLDVVHPAVVDTVVDVVEGTVWTTSTEHRADSFVGDEVQGPVQGP
jgi:hypothetical protein